MNIKIKERKKINKLIQLISVAILDELDVEINKKKNMGTKMDYEKG